MDTIKQQIKEKVRENSKALSYERIKFLYCHTMGMLDLKKQCNPSNSINMFQSKPSEGRPGDHLSH